MTKTPHDEPDADSIDTGKPIAELREFGQRTDTSDDFLSRLRNRLERRRATGHLIDFTFSGPLLLLVQFLEMFFGMFDSHEKP